MVHYEAEETLAVPLAKLWTFLNLHTTPEIANIHTEIQAQERVGPPGREMTLKRTIDMRGKTVHSTWKVTSSPPWSSRWEVLEGTGPWAPGTYLENTYTEVAGGTRVRSVGDLKVVGVPFFLQKRIVGAVLDHISDQDVAYLKAHP